MTDKQRVFVVDDDPDIQSSLHRLFNSVHIPVELFETAEEFLKANRAPAAGCLLLDVRMPGMGGLRFLEHLQTFPVHPPAIMLTGHGDIPMVLQALKSGALDFIEKPANAQKLLEAVHHAFAVDLEQRAQQRRKKHFDACLASLSAREREVLQRMIDGVVNKAIAMDLGISERTLEKHRTHIMHKMEVTSLAELIRNVVVYGIH